MPGTWYPTVTYDELSQLTALQWPSLTTTSFLYDAVGNRTNRSVGGLSGESYVTNTLNQYTSLTSFDLPQTTTLTSDANGNLTDHGTARHYTYDSENRLLSASASGMSSQYTYDPFGRRLSKTVNGTTTRFLYDGDQVLADTTSAGTVQATYVFGPGIDEPLRMIRGAVTSYYHADGLGNLIALSNTDGTLAESTTYDVFGKPSTTSTLGNRFLFTGREYDTEIGLYYYRARYYDPRLGRFLQRDPLGYLPDTNLYRYVWNSSLNRIDPGGLITRHEEGNWGAIKEFLDIFEAEVSFGAQAGAKVHILGGVVEGKVDLGTQRTAFEGAALKNSTSQGLKIGATFGEKIGVALERTKEREGHPAPQVWEGAQRLSGESILEYLQWVDWKDKGMIGISHLSVDEKTDIRFGGGIALLFGFEGYLNLSELYDFAQTWQRCKGQSN